MTDHRGRRSADNVIPFPHPGEPRQAGATCPPSRGTGADPATDWDEPGGSLSEVVLRGHAFGGAERASAERTQAPSLHQARDGSVMLCLLVDLENSFPQVWRRVEVAADLRLDQLHHVISEAMGWQDVHLHGFRAAFPGDAGVVLPTLITDAELTDAELDDAELDDAETAYDLRHSRDRLGRGRPRWGCDEQVHESQVQVGQVVADVGDALHYDYDMACGWRHVITVEGVRLRLPGEPRAVLLAGERACPLEDCGGVWMYNDIVSLLAGAGVERLQTHPGDVLDQIDWLPDGFDPEEFDLEKARRRVGGVDLHDLPPPMPPLETLTPALADLVTSCDIKGRRALAHLLAAAGLDAFTLLEEHRRASVDGERAGIAVVDSTRAFATGSGPGAPLPARLDEAACARMVAPFVALLDAVDRASSGVPAGDDCPFSRRLVTTAVALGLVACVRGRLVRHPTLALGERGRSESPARGLATHIAHRLPIGVAPHEIDAGTLALLSAATGLTKYEILDSDLKGQPHRIAQLWQTVIEVAGWRTRAGRVNKQAVAFWADETWSVLSLLSGGSGSSSREFAAGDALPFSAPRVPADVQALARAALRISSMPTRTGHGV